MEVYPFSALIISLSLGKDKKKKKRKKKKFALPSFLYDLKAKRRITELKKSERETKNRTE